MKPEKIEIWGEFEDKEQTIIAYFLPKDEVNFILKPNSPDSYLKNFIRKLEDWEIVKYKLLGTQDFK